MADPCPTSPCEYCIGNSSVHKDNGELMTSWEWCQDVDTCAATIDWELILHGR